MKNISNWFFRLAVVYLMVGVSLGIAMAASHDHSMFPVHAHLNLLGWVSMCLFALFYRAWPAAAESRLARFHFWLYVPAHFVQMIALAILFRGVPSIEPLLGIVSVVVALGMLCFAFIVWKYTAVGTVGALQPGAMPKAGTAS